MKKIRFGAKVTVNNSHGRFEGIVLDATNPRQPLVQLFTNPPKLERVLVEHDVDGKAVAVTVNRGHGADGKPIEVPALEVIAHQDAGSEPAAVE